MQEYSSGSIVEANDCFKFIPEFWTNIMNLFISCNVFADRGPARTPNGIPIKVQLRVRALCLVTVSG